MLKTIKMLRNREILFCDINPACYKISMGKEIFLRHLKDLFSRQKFAKIIKKEKLPFIISNHSSNIIKRSQGVDLKSQENKKVNIILSCEKINGIIIRPGEIFSFWKTIGKASKKRGFKSGRILRNNKLTTGIGGGLCNLANTIHLLVLHSPLQVNEFHGHSDALAPDEGKRVPFSAGTSVFYNYIDYRFKNNTNHDFQLLAWCENDMLHAELRSTEENIYSYKLIEENHHFRKEKDKYYRISKIYKETSDILTGDIIERELILDNHSEVMFDYELIPKELIKQYNTKH